jgi:hypothetical protein
LTRIEEQIQSGAASDPSTAWLRPQGQIFSNDIRPEPADRGHTTLWCGAPTNPLSIHSRLSLMRPAMIQADQGQMELVLLNLCF